MCSTALLPRTRPRCRSCRSRAWMSTPPSSSLLDRRSRSARCTTGGPATKTCETPRTISEKCERGHARRAQPGHQVRAPPPPPAPRPAVATIRSQPGLRGHVGAPGLLVGLDAAAAAGAVDEPDDRQAQLPGHPLAVDLLGVDGGIGRAATHGEVVSARPRPAVRRSARYRARSSRAGSSRASPSAYVALPGERARLRGASPRRAARRCARAP